MILRRKTGICEIAINMTPFAKTTIIEHLQFVGDDKGNNTTTQTLLEHDESPNTTITILEWVYLFETNVEVKNILKSNLFLSVVAFYQSLHTIMHLLWLTCILTTHLVGQSLVVANSKPVYATVGCACFQNAMQRLNQFFRKRISFTFSVSSAVTPMVFVSKM